MMRTWTSARRAGAIREDDDRRLLRSCFAVAVVVHGGLLLLPAPRSDASAPPEPPPREVFRLPDFRLPEPELEPTPEIPPEPPGPREPIPVPELLVDDPVPEHSTLPDHDFDTPAEAPVRIPDVAPSPEPAPHGPVYVVGEVVPPEKLHAPRPRYPEAARQAGVAGVVILQATIDREGAVTEVDVLRGAPLGMTEAAVEAVRRWRFRPATLEGRRVAVYYQLTVRFQSR